MTTADRRVALVTGASRGIGALVADRLAAEGYDLTVSARSAGSLDELSGTCAQMHGARVRTVLADQEREDDVHRLVEEHCAAYDRLDVLVLNAGAGSTGSLAGFPAHRLDKLYAINLRSPFVLTQALLPLLRATAERSGGSAKVIALSSLTGIAAEPLGSAYGAMKAALTSMCESINAEESDAGVVATALCPGYVATDLTAPLADRIAPDDMIDAADVAELVVSLTRLSRSVVVPYVPMTRPGARLWRA